MTDTTTPRLQAETAVCVLTARGMAAIAAVALFGEGAEAMLRGMFSNTPPDVGRFGYGTISDGDNVIDSVVVGCEAPGCYVIGAHGNPLLVERIVRLAERRGAAVQLSQDYHFARYQALAPTRIEAEARLAMTQAATLEAVRWLAAQIDGGLSAWATGWIQAETLDIENIKRECRQIAARSRIARRLIEPVRVVLVGPPNSGKSTLLNWLAAENTALVSDAAGTTRDWVSVDCRIGPLRVELIDTAGLDAGLAGKTELDKTAQEAAMAVLKTGDLILNVHDATRPAAGGVGEIGDVPMLTVLTKSDLLGDRLPETSEGLWVSAVRHQGLETLCQAIITALQVDTVDTSSAICVTPRQWICLEKLMRSATQQDAHERLVELVGAKAGQVSSTDQ